MVKLFDRFNTFWKSEVGLWVIILVCVISLPLHILNFMEDNMNKWACCFFIAWCVYYLPMSIWRLYKLWGKKDEHNQ